jgi:hypothetical protein
MILAGGIPLDLRRPGELGSKDNRVWTFGGSRPDRLVGGMAAPRRVKRNPIKVS